MLDRMMDLTALATLRSLARSELVALKPLLEAAGKRRALRNLLDNTIDFSPECSSVRVQVQDSGPGIPDCAQEKVFENCYSLTLPHSHQKSTGRSLTFAKEIASLHRGHITLTSAPECAAAPIFSLPRSGW